jgi:hypothetical protein
VTWLLDVGAHYIANHTALNMHIPVLGVSPSEIVIFADKLAHMAIDLTDSPAGSFPPSITIITSLTTTVITDRVNSKCDATIKRNVGCFAEFQYGYI